MWKTITNHWLKSNINFQNITWCIMQYNVMSHHTISLLLSLLLLNMNSYHKADSVTKQILEIKTLKYINTVETPSSMTVWHEIRYKMMDPTINKYHVRTWLCDQLFEFNKYTFYLMIYCTLGQFWLVSNMGLLKEGITGDWLAHIFTPYKKIKAMFCWR